MTDTKPEDHWSSEAYQKSASFVAKLATKVVQWLDLQPDDVVLDIGCGDGIIDGQMVEVLSHGSGRVVGVDSSAAMIDAARSLVKDAPEGKATFEVINANDLAKSQALQPGTFTKVFSNAALHWILAEDRSPAAHASFFTTVRDLLRPGGKLVFEMGGLGNVAEMRAAILSGVARRVGLETVAAVEPWFFPDVDWAKDMLETQVGGFVVEQAELAPRSTPADVGGVDGWVRLMAKKYLALVPEAQREECTREIVDVLRVVCAVPGGGESIGYVRLRVIARKL